VNKPFGEVGSTPTSCFNYIRERSIMDAENVSEFYYEQLKDTTNPALVLSRFFGSLFSRDYGRSEVILFNRLLKIYGRFTVYFSLLDMTSMTEINFDNIYGLISYFAKKRIEQKYGILVIETRSLDKEVGVLEKLIAKQKKVKLNVQELEND
jgi:hypothetical protein